MRCTQFATITQSTTIVDPSVVKVVKISFSNSSVESSFEIPANSEIYESEIDILSTYGSGAIIKFGHNNIIDLLQSSESKTIKPNTIGNYEITKTKSWGASDRKAKITLSGTGLTGNGIARLWFSVPNE